MKREVEKWSEQTILNQKKREKHTKETEPFYIYPESFLNS